MIMNSIGWPLNPGLLCLVIPTADESAISPSVVSYSVKESVKYYNVPTMSII